MQNVDRLSASGGRPEEGLTRPQRAEPAEATTGKFTVVWEFCNSVMIPPLVHQRRPCYDFYFL
jgi:hypothetical protein